MQVYVLNHKGKPVKTTLNIDDDLIERASKMTGIKEKTTLVKLGLEALIAMESAKRLARLGGSEKHLKQVPRRRSAWVVLVDTSVWVSHLRETNESLVGLLNDGKVVCHPFVIGELACGGLQNRMVILSLLEALPKAQEASHNEVLGFIDAHKIMGKGLGYVDVHLLASAFLSGVALWTLDKRLVRAAEELQCKW
jgi:predicted nucleic acid-binding protein/Arc/MetJ family transcription regulator